MNLDEAQRAVDTLMYDVVTSDISILQEASRHIILAGGKRVRPRLLFLAFLAAGGTDLKYTIPVAAAIELVHTATLVHDDINDYGKMRRGRETVNERWGRTFALLTGDFLFTQVYSLMAPYSDLNIDFAEATVALVEGETLQAVAAKEDTLNREAYQQIVAKKTASLFRTAAILGAKLANSKQSLVDALGEYGFYLGLIFQIVDDMLDLTGDPRLMGKAAGVDTAQGKGVATAYARSDNGRDNGSSSELTVVEKQEEVDPFLTIKRQLIASGAVEEGQQMAQIVAAQAHAALDKLPPSPAVDEMRNLITYVLERDH